VGLVFLQHFSVQILILFPPQGATRVIAEVFRNYGNLGVELFFVLSGYLIYGALIRRPSFVRFMKRRIQRIYPAFLVALAIGLAIVIFIPESNAKMPQGLGPAALYVLANLLLLPGLFPITPIFAVAWTLSYEMFFYFSIAVVATTLHLDRRRRGFRIGLIVLCAGLLTGLGLLGIPYVPIRMMPFLAGMLLAELGHVKGSPWLGIVALAAPVLAVLASNSQQLFGVRLSGSELLWEWVHTVAFFALCFSCFRPGNENVAAVLFSWTPLRWLGNMSYSYYLLHGFVVKGAMVAIASVIAVRLGGVEFWLLLLPIFVLTLVLSAFLFLWIEKPYSLERRRIAMQSVRSAPLG
jgi:peptidoglycan/LPS O-acetylase OafA/YrhL